MNQPYPQPGIGPTPPGHGYDIVRSNESKRRRRRQLILLGILLLLLALVAYTTYYFISNRKLPVPGAEPEQLIVGPQYLYSINGPEGANALTRPVSVAVGKNDWVYATDTKSKVIRVYEQDGKYRRTIDRANETSLGVPAHLAVGPRDELYVSDRRLRKVFVFTAEGEYIREIAPTGEDEKIWGPLGMGFDEEGNLYVTDAGIEDKHRIIVFDPTGKEILRFGKTGRAETMSDYPGDLYFPNNVIISEDGLIYVSDSNNRRVQVFSKDGTFQRIIRTSGIPRGIVRDAEDRLYVVDALSHQVDVFDTEDKKIIGFGESGIGPGQFRYANDIDLDSRGRIFVTDRENHQVQVWGWPVEPVPTPVLPSSPGGWAACLSPLLLLPLLLLLRKRKYVVAPEYLDAVIEADLLPTMAEMRRTRFVIPPEEWDAYADRVVDGVRVSSVVHPDAYSDTDVRSLMERLNVGRPEGTLLAMAERNKRLCTTDENLSALAAALGVEVFGLELVSGARKVDDAA